MPDADLDLFAIEPIDDRLESLFGDAVHRARCAPHEELAAPEQLIRGLLLDAPQVHLDQAWAMPLETVPVQRPDGNGGFTVTYEQRLTVVVPATGDTWLLKFKTGNTESVTGSVSGDAVRLVFQGAGLVYLPQIETRVAHARHLLQGQVDVARAKVREHNERVRSAVEEQLAKRREDIEAAGRLLAKLGIAAGPPGPGGAGT